MATSGLRFQCCYSQIALVPYFLLLVSPVVLAGSPLARAQSSEEVHTIPCHSPNRELPGAKDIPAGREPAVHAHMKSFRVNVDLVMVPVTVTDAMNHPITGLGRENFSIYEHGEAQRIRYFSAEDAPISVGLILDFSKSMTDKIATERSAVAQFFQTANPADDYFVVTVSDQPKLIATTTQSIGTIQSNLALAVPDGSTALLDGIYLGAAQMRLARYQRKALLIISDGGDNNSRYRLKEIKALLRESDIEVYAIGLFDTTLFKTFEEYMGKKWLEEITDTAGGRTVAVDNLAQLPAVAAAISWELRNQYVLGYNPSNVADGKWRKIKVQVNPPPGKPALQAYYKRGYWAPDR